MGSQAAVDLQVCQVVLANLETLVGKVLLARKERRVLVDDQVIQAHKDHQACQVSVEKLAAQDPKETSASPLQENQEPQDHQAFLGGMASLDPQDQWVLGAYLETARMASQVALEKLVTVVCVAYLALLAGMVYQVALELKVMLARTVSVASVRRVKEVFQDSQAMQAFQEHVVHQDLLATQVTEAKMARWGCLVCLARRV